MSTVYTGCVVPVVTEDFSTDLSDYAVTVGDASPFSVVSGELKITNDAVTSVISRAIGSFPVHTMQFDFRINASGANDVGSLAVIWDSYFIQFYPRRSNAVDASRLCRLASTADSTGVALYGSALTFDVDYRAVITVDYVSGDFSVTLSIVGGATLGTTSVPGSVSGNTLHLRFATSDDATGIAYYDDITLTGVC